VREAQSRGRSGDTPKGLNNFGDDRFSNLLEKHKEQKVHGEASHASAYLSANLGID